MERKTTVQAETGKQEVVITREFGLPLELLFEAYTDPGLVAQWMNTNVLALESRKHGSWQFETRAANGKVVYRANGVIHEFEPNCRIIRTSEIENMPLGVQLEFLTFERLSDDTSRLTIQVVYRSVADRDQMLQRPFAQGLNGAHNRLEILFDKIPLPNRS